MTKLETAISVKFIKLFSEESNACNVYVISQLYNKNERVRTRTSPPDKKTRAEKNDHHGITQ